MEESSDSGSEFELSEADSIEGSQDETDITPETKIRTYAQALEDEGIDADDVLMDFAIKESLNDADNDNSVRNGTSSRGAGSSKPIKARTAAAALRAAAADRRLSRARKGTRSMVDNDYEPPEDDEDKDEKNADLSPSSEDEQPLSKKGKAKAKVVTRSRVADAPKYMTFADMKERKAESRRLARQRKAEERGLAAKLGRRLTQVTIPALRNRRRSNMAMTGREEHNCVAEASS